MKKIFEKISDKQIIFCLFFIMTIQLVILSLNIPSEQRFHSYKEIQKTILETRNVIDFYNTLPPEILNHLFLHQLIHKDVYTLSFDKILLQVKLTDSPKWQLHFNHNMSFDELKKIIEHNKEGFSLSYQLSEKKWLNFHAYVPQERMILHIFSISLNLLTISLILLLIRSFFSFLYSLEKVKNSAEQLGVDLNCQPNFIAQGPRIIQEVNYAMTKLQERIKELLIKRAQVIAGISHDLRTPITRMKLRTRLLEDEQFSQKYIKDLDEMEEIINDTLLFAKEDRIQEKKVLLDLNLLLLSIFEDAVAMNYNISYVELNRPVLYSGSPIALKRAFTNIINNAIKYASTVTMELHCSENHYLIIINDNGSGIPAHELEKVTQPYYRGTNAHNHIQRGSGLGLAIAHEIIIIHYGNLTLKNRSEGGLSCEIVLNLEAP